jgi:RNA-binding protein PNO1
MTEMEMEMDMDSGVDVPMSSASTTIDPSVVQSRIRQSMSLQKADQEENMDDDVDQPVFPQLSAAQANGNKVEYRRVRCPPHRYTPLREHWEQILTPLVEYLKLQVRVATPSGRWFLPLALGWQLKKYPFTSECTLCCSWNFKPSGKPQCYNERDGADIFICCLMSVHAYDVEPKLLFQYDFFLTLSPLMLLFQVRFNTKSRCVEMKTSPHSLMGALQKGADFVSAFMMGFEVQDAVALLRLDDLYVESFQVTDVKLLKGDHLSRAIGRVAGQDGKTRFAIENATRTRIVIADQRIHMLGSYSNLRMARNAICDLILGAPPGKVYNNMRNVAKRMSERY